MTSIKLPDGSVREMPDNVTGMEVAASIGKGLAKAAVAARGREHRRSLARSRRASISSRCSPIAIPMRCTSCVTRTAHVMAEAIQRIWPQALLAYGPAVENGFYYDIALDASDLHFRLREDRSRDGEDRRGRSAVHSL